MSMSCRVAHLARWKENSLQTTKQLTTFRQFSIIVWIACHNSSRSFMIISTNSLSLEAVMSPIKRSCLKGMSSGTVRRLKLVVFSEIWKL